MTSSKPSQLQDAMVAWEVGADGQPAQAWDSKRTTFEAGLRLRRVAMSKLEGVSLLSAQFGESVEVFEPRFQLVVERWDRADAVGLFLSDNGGLACLRTASWDRARDYASFAAARDKHAYLRGPDQVCASLRFVDQAKVPIDLLTAADRLLKRGVSFDEGQPEHPWSRVRLDLVLEDGSMLWLALMPRTCWAPSLEQLVNAWLQYAGNHVDQGVIADEIRVTRSPDLLNELRFAYPLEHR